MASSDGVPRAVKFATAGVGGVFGWVVVHPFNTAAVRMNLAASQPGYQRTGFLSFAARTASRCACIALSRRRALMTSTRCSSRVEWRCVCAASTSRSLTNLLESWCSLLWTCRVLS